MNAIRAGLGTAIVIVGLFSTVTSSDQSVTRGPMRVVVTEYSDLVRDELVMKDEVLANWNEILSHAQLFTTESSNGIEKGMFIFDNPFHSVSNVGGESLQVIVELEQVDYGSGHDAQNQLTAYSMFGLIGLQMTAGESRLGTVQIRLTASRGMSNAHVVAVGVGHALAPPKLGPRRILVPVAASPDYS